jgi:hypothetical protein
MKYITCEGRFSIVYSYHFQLLSEFRHRMDLPPKQKLNIPYFLLQSLIEYGTKLKKGNTRRQERKAVVRRPRIGHHRTSHRRSKRKSKKEKKEET